MLIPLGFWGASGAGGGGATDFQLISTQVLGSTATSVTFSSIPSTFRHLQIRMVTRGTENQIVGGMGVRFNGDTGANYVWHRLRGNGASVSSDTSGGATSYGPDNLVQPGLTATASAFGGVVMDVLDYGNINKFKTSRLLDGFATNGGVDLISGLWMSTSAISSISVIDRWAGSFAIGSRFSLYGWN